MKLRSKRDERYQFKLQGRYRWHSWFAWRPVHISERKFEEIVVPEHWAWLETVERKRDSGAWIYRTAPSYS